MQCQRTKKGVWAPLELELEMVESNHIGAGNLTLVLWKPGLKLLDHPPGPQPDCKPVVLAFPFWEAEGSVNS